MKELASLWIIKIHLIQSVWISKRQDWKREEKEVTGLIRAVGNPFIQGTMRTVMGKVRSIPARLNTVGCDCSMEKDSYREDMTVVCEIMNGRESHKRLGVSDV